MQTRISIIVPCYNGAKYIRETLDCLQKQTIDDWECIIVNDGSTDNSLEIMKEFSLKDERFRFVDKQNGGPASARNLGVASSKGEYLLFLDSDDIIDNYYLEKGICYLDNHKDCSLFYSRTKFFGARNDVMDSILTGYRDLLAKNSIVCTCIIRRNDFDRVGGFDENMHGYEDWEFFIRLLYHNDVVYQCPKVMFYYRMHDNHIGVNAGAKKREEELRCYFFDKHYTIYKEYFGYPQWIYGEYNRLEHELEGILNSKSYKLGHKILNPILWLKKKLLM